ncbi:NAD(P)/FAD-dependent oxidoreductase [Povalibacter sp.]|uniref:FAD-dependent oxidoreductase n=1 Tax=Povalibacter sp. TaxID=1962978 RepID=UPI002F40394E
MPSTPSAADDSPITLIGAGLAGTLLAILLARRGHRVRVYERLPDQRREVIPAGRSINLALAARGIAALERADVMQQILPLLIPMPGRLLHLPDGAQNFLPYGQHDHEVIYSVSRPGLNRLLLDAAEAVGVELHFRQRSVDVDLRAQRLLMRDESNGNSWELPLHRVIAADGAGSPLRGALAHGLESRVREDWLEHSYKELTLPADTFGNHRLHKNALHIWPRGGFMLIALPNIDGSFTVTLFLPRQGPESFATLQDEPGINAFFQRHFPDAALLMPQLAREFLEHPTGSMATVRSERWSHQDRLLLIGDAAHAITPFHGQGMNCAFEDCSELDTLLQQHSNWDEAFAAFDRTRHPHTDAIATMALENYEEMRDSVRHPKFQLQKTLSLQLELRFPDRFVPRYSMVMFHDSIPYALAYERGRIQQEILDLLTRKVTTLDQIDFDLAAQLIQQRLEPIAGT